MAEELYREWFVRLRFPGHERVKEGRAGGVGGDEDGRCLRFHWWRHTGQRESAFL